MPASSGAIGSSGIQEIADYVDWMNRDLPIGGIELPNEETRVLFAARALKLADRLQHLCRHFPQSFRASTTRAAILYQCWARTHEIQLRTRRNLAPQMNLLRTVRATDVLKLLDGERKWYLMEADDDENYIVKLPRETREILATELICTEAARLFKLPIPPAAVVVLNRKLLSRCEELNPCGSSKPKQEPIFAFGLRVSASTDEIIRGQSAVSALSHCKKRISAGALVFDIWVLNSITDQVVIEFDSLNGKRQLRFIDKSRCFLESDWSRYMHATPSEPVVCHPSGTRITRWHDLEHWLRLADNFPHRRLWDLCMHMPPSWYREDKIVLANLLSEFMERGSHLRQIVWRLTREHYFPRYKEIEKMANKARAGDQETKAAAAEKSVARSHVA